MRNITRAFCIAIKFQVVLRKFENRVDRKFRDCTASGRIVSAALVQHCNVSRAIVITRSKPRTDFPAGTISHAAGTSTHEVLNHRYGALCSSAMQSLRVSALARALAFLPVTPLDELLEQGVVFALRNRGTRWRRAICECLKLALDVLLSGQLATIFAL